MADKPLDSQEKLKEFRRVWDREMRQELDQNLALVTLTTLSQILGNVVAHPEEEKYRKLPATNKRLLETVLERKGGKTFLVSCGFHKKFFDDKDFWYLSVGQHTMEIIKIGLELINEKKDQISATAELEKKRDLLEKEKKCSKNCNSQTTI